MNGLFKHKYGTMLKPGNVQLYAIFNVFNNLLDLYQYIVILNYSLVGEHLMVLESTDLII